MVGFGIRGDAEVIAEIRNMVQKHNRGRGNSVILDLYFIVDSLPKNMFSGQSNTGVSATHKFEPVSQPSPPPACLPLEV